jgi:hypothetical protein
MKKVVIFSWKKIISYYFMNAYILLKIFNYKSMNPLKFFEFYILKNRLKKLPSAAVIAITFATETTF